MSNVNIEQPKDLRTIEIGQVNSDEPSSPTNSERGSLQLGVSSPEKTVLEQHSNFGPDMSGSDEDEASEVN